MNKRMNENCSKIQIHSCFSSYLSIFKYNAEFQTYNTCTLSNSPVNLFSSRNEHKDREKKRFTNT